MVPNGKSTPINSNKRPFHLSFLVFTAMVMAQLVKAPMAIIGLTPLFRPILLGIYTLAPMVASVSRTVMKSISAFPSAASWPSKLTTSILRRMGIEGFSLATVSSEF